MTHVTYTSLLMLEVHRIMLQYQKMGYALGYRNLDQMRDWLYDAFARVSQVRNRRLSVFVPLIKLRRII